MSTVINRTTLQLVYSVNTPDYLETDWIINPDLSLLINVPRKYWKIQGDSVLEMADEEKAIIDSQIQANSFPFSQQVSSSDTSETNSLDYISKLDLNINLELNKQYQAIFNFAWSYGSINSAFKCRLIYTKDNLVTDLYQLSLTPKVSSDVMPFSGIKNFSVNNSGIYTFSIEYASSNNNIVAKIYDASIEIRRI